MKVTTADEHGACDLIVAEFFFGPRRCSQRTIWQTEEDGDVFYICSDHIARLRQQKATP